RDRSPGDPASIPSNAHLRSMDPCVGHTHTRGRKLTKPGGGTMKRILALAGLLVGIASIAAGSPTAASNARKFAPHQEPRAIGNLVVRGDHVALVYDAGVKSATGSVYVRSDLQRRFVRLSLAAERGPASTY